MINPELDNVLRPYLLWTNPNPTSSLSSITVSVSNCNEYSYFDVELRYAIDNAHSNIQRMSYNTAGAFFLLPNTGTAGTIYIREISSMSSSNIVIGEAFIPGTGYYNDKVIPVKIIGYK